MSLRTFLNPNVFAGDVTSTMPGGVFFGSDALENMPPVIDAETVLPDISEPVLPDDTFVLDDPAPTPVRTNNIDRLTSPADHEATASWTMRALAFGGAVLYPGEAKAESVFREIIHGAPPLVNDILYMTSTLLVIVASGMAGIELAYQLSTRYFQRIEYLYHQVLHRLADPHPQYQTFRSDRSKPKIEKYFPDGYVKTPMSQHGIGDCYLIAYYHSTKLHPISAALLKYMFQHESAGSVLHVKFLGLDQSIPVRVSDLSDRVKIYNPQKKQWVLKRYASGAVGDKVIERAFVEAVYQNAKGRRARQKRKGFASEDTIDAGWARDVFNFFISSKYGIHREVDAAARGLPPHVHRDVFAESRFHQKQAEKILTVFAQNPLKYILTVHTPEKVTPWFTKRSPENYYYMDVEKKFPTEHVYSVIFVDVVMREVVVVNPHDTTKEILLGFDEFYKIFGHIEVTTLNFDRLQEMLGPLDFLKPQKNTEGELSKKVQYEYNLADDSRLHISLAKYNLKVWIKDGQLYIKGEGIPDKFTQGVSPGQKIVLGSSNIAVSKWRKVSLKHLSLELKSNGTMVVTDNGSLKGTRVRIHHNLPDYK